jgi:hypothetical protein
MIPFILWLRRLTFAQYNREALRDLALVEMPMIEAGIQLA